MVLQGLLIKFLYLPRRATTEKEKGAGDIQALSPLASKLYNTITTIFCEAFICVTTESAKGSRVSPSL